MPSPRSNIVDLSVTPYYHCISRCVRRAYLCGRDAYSGQDYSHRREWVESRLKTLAERFAIDICAYAVMSNHLHVILRVDAEQSARWDNDEIVERYTALFPSMKDIEPSAEQLDDWRARLTDISWFMRTLNEHIARKANKEDKVTGRFWEGRFKSQPIVDTAGLLTCMAYVDLNPIRAKVATDLASSEFTSIYSRLSEKNTALAPFSDATSPQNKPPLPCSLDSYLALLTWTMENSRTTKLAATPIPVLLHTYQLSSHGWLEELSGKDIVTATFLGKPDALVAIARRKNKAWVKGLSLARRLAA